VPRSPNSKTREGLYPRDPLPAARLREEKVDEFVTLAYAATWLLNEDHHQELSLRAKIPRERVVSERQSPACRSPVSVKVRFCIHIE